MSVQVCGKCQSPFDTRDKLLSSPRAKLCKQTFTKNEDVSPDIDSLKLEGKIVNEKVTIEIDSNTYPKQLPEIGVSKSEWNIRYMKSFWLHRCGCIDSRWRRGGRVCIHRKCGTVGRCD